MEFVVLHRKSCTLSHDSDAGEKEGRPSTLLLVVIAGEAACLSTMSDILPPVLRP